MPSYLFEEDAVHFHSTLKKAWDAHGSQIYPTFKTWWDEYFYTPHRDETRGIGGIFFDDLNEGTHARLPSSSPHPTTPAEIFSFVQDLGNTSIPSYLLIFTKRSTVPYTPLQRRWQLVRRGRYVEFNLVYDKGTKFGLMTPGAQTESI